MKLLLSSILIALSVQYKECCPPATPENVQKWEKRNKFRAQLTRECDSLRHVKGLAAFRKY